jgi:hypothetical protein
MIIIFTNFSPASSEASSCFPYARSSAFMPSSSFLNPNPSASATRCTKAFILRAIDAKVTQQVKTFVRPVAQYDTAAANDDAMSVLDKGHC